jgi:hypothetical protein
MLIERGNAIKGNKMDKKKEIEDNIIKHLKDNEDQICMPKEAYITFETEEAFHRAIRFNLTKECGKVKPSKEWNGENLIMQTIGEPSNMRWENSYKNPLVTTFKIITVSLILFFALILTCYLIFVFQSRINRLNRQYPIVD